VFDFINDIPTEGWVFFGIVLFLWLPGFILTVQGKLTKARAIAPKR